MMKIVPVVSVSTVISRKPQPGCGTSLAPLGLCFSSQNAMPVAWMTESSTVP